MSLSRIATFAALPPVWPHDVLPGIRVALHGSPHKLVVLDDDPTGTQTVHDIAVITQWDLAILRAEFARPEPGFYILTNSRSLSAPAADALNRELARNLRTAARETGRAFTLVSRSDSTLRGHFPLETDALAEVCGPFDATLVAPYFEAGGRFTIGDTHYVAEGDTLVPAGETPFARDAVFGYTHSDLRAWIEEKTAGRVHAAEVCSLSLELIRREGPEAVTAALLAVPPGAFVVVNAAALRDMDVVALATLRAEAAGRRLLFRTAAAFVAARLGLAPRPCLDASGLSVANRHGGLIVAGSHVPKTTEQLGRLRATAALHSIELDVETLIDPTRRETVIADAIRRTNAALANGEDTLVFTSRRLISGGTPTESLAIGEKVSRALINLVQGLVVSPRFLIAKGGITSSDIATQGLGVRRAIVAGQLLPGVPVWRLGNETKFPGLNYVVFPGNVGGATALADAVALLRGTR